MNKVVKVTALGFGVGLVLASNIANADMKIYGKAHVAVESASSVTALKSNASRLGIKGSMKVSDDLKAVYKYEMGYDIDGSSGSPAFITQRSQYVGLKGGFGKVIAGINDTPLKKLEGGDLFGDTYADLGKVFDAYVDSQEREAGFVGYYAPTMGELNLAVALMPGKGGTSLTDAASLAGMFGDSKLKKSAYYVGLGFDNAVDGKDTSVLRLSGGSKFGVITARGIFESAKNAAGDSQTRIMANASMKIGSGKIKLQIANADKVGATAASTQTSFGYETKLGKKTTLYVHSSSQDLKGTKTGYASIGLIQKF